MIREIEGNILESKAEALVNTVNTVGVMGKGLALQFKKAFPENYKKYVIACKNKEIDIGTLFVTKEKTLDGEKIIINFPTKKHWKKPSEYIYIEKGLDDLIRIIKEYNIKSIAIPPLGCNNGGLNWDKVKKIIINKLSHLDIEIYLYQPTKEIKEKLAKERIKLTPARALLLYLLFDLDRYGEFVSEFTAEKICYFLQRFGAEKYFKLKYAPKFYGPYSGKVRYVLNYLNGSYITGYSDMNRKPFEPLFLIPETYNEVKYYIENNHELKNIAYKTKEFLTGFYSEFDLELLSSVDWIMIQLQTDNIEDIKKELKNWSKRKKDKFSNDNVLKIAIDHIKKFGLFQ